MTPKNTRMYEREIKTQELKQAISWLYMQSAHLFLAGEIIELHEACEFLDNPIRWEHDLESVWKHITQNLKPAIEIRIAREETADNPTAIVPKRGLSRKRGPSGKRGKRGGIDQFGKPISPYRRKHGT
jgi:hypothetical protein